MDQNSSLPDDLLMAMLPYGADATNTYPLNSEDCLDPRELCNSLYAPTAHENASWPSPNGGALDDVSTQWNVLELDSYIDFNSGSLANDLNIPSTMQLASNTFTMPWNDLSFGPSPIPSREIKVEKGDNKCPQCSRQFKGGAAQVRKHIIRVHINKGHIVGEVVRSTPGRAKTKVIRKDIKRPATKRRRVDGEDAGAYLPPATHHQSKESTHVTIQEFRNTQKELATLRQQLADWEISTMRLQIGMNNQSHGTLARFDKSFEECLFANLKNRKTACFVRLEKNASRSGDYEFIVQVTLLTDTILTTYPKEICRCTLVYANGTFKWLIRSTNRTFEYKLKPEKEKTLRGETCFRISIDRKSDSLSWFVNRIFDSGVLNSYGLFTQGNSRFIVH